VQVFANAPHVRNLAKTRAGVGFLKSDVSCFGPDVFRDHGRFVFVILIEKPVDFVVTIPCNSTALWENSTWDRSSFVSMSKNVRGLAYSVL